MKHFIAMAGLHGYLPNYCEAFRSRDHAVSSLADTHELGRKRRADLKRDGTLELNLKRDGNEYCEIAECDCAEPWNHAESDSRGNWEEFEADR